MTATPVQIAAGDSGRPRDLAPSSIYIKRMRFDAPDALAVLEKIEADPNRLQVRLELNHADTLLADGACEVLLSLRLTGIWEDRMVYQAEVHQAGVFDLAQTGAELRSRQTDCLLALLPRAQDFATRMIRGAGFPPFNFPAADLHGLTAERQPAEMDAASLQQLQQFWKALTRLMAAKASSRVTDFRPIYAESLVVAQLSRDALPAADKFLALGPSQPVALEMLGAIYTMNNMQQRAVQVYRHTVAAAPADARARYNLGTSLMFTGDLAGAQHEINKCIEIQPTFWEAYSVLSRLRRQSAQHNHVDDLQTLLSRFGDQDEARQRLNLALAKEYEDLGDHARAFAHLSRGNAVVSSRQNYSSRQDQAIFDALIEHAPEVQPASSGYATDEPIFVFGMPRSGTTLVERILSSHADVASAGELKQLGVLLKYMSGSPSADLLDVDTIVRCRQLDWHALGERYLMSTRPLSGQTPRFIDKFPHHFLYAAYLANALPQARIICVRRNPMDTCLGNFRQGFSEASPFHRYAFDLLDIGRYYVMFDRLMAHWRTALPGRILEVSYESLVQDQEPTTRAMLDFCGLCWDPACLAFEKNSAPVDTASAVQVRQPIYRSALGRWKQYAEELTPLRNLLVDAGIDVPLL